MKKLLMFAAIIGLTACPVACVNDPTASDSTCVKTDTDTDVCSVDSTETNTAE